MWHSRSLAAGEGKVATGDLRNSTDAPFLES
jgi:hypothetical protein